MTDKYLLPLSPPTFGLPMTSRCGFRTSAKQNSRSHQNFHLTRTLSFGSSTMHPSRFSNSQTFATVCIIVAAEPILQL